MHTDKLSSEDVPGTSSYADILLVVQHRVGDWTTWLKRLKGRKKSPPLLKLLSSNALFWGQPTQSVIHQSTTARLLQVKANRSKQQDEFDWHEAADQLIANNKERLTVQLGIEVIAWTHALPGLAHHLPELTWQQLVATLIELTQQSSVATFEEDPMLRFLVSCELPMTLAYVLPEVCKGKHEQARDAFADSMNTLLDGEGMPHARHLTSIQMLLASCTRTLTLDAEIKKGRVGKSARLQYDWLCRQLLRWSRPSGTAIFQEETDSPYFDELMKATLKITKDESDAAAYKLLRDKRKSTDYDVPACSEHSEWSEAATMRTNWSSGAARLAVAFPTSELNVELAVGQQVIFSGSCLPRVVVNDEPLTLQSDWEEVCWETDDDMDYIELACSLSDGWSVQRQFLLARKDQFVLISDAILGPSTATIKYQHQLPLQDGVILEQTGETTEAQILGDSRLGTVIPLSLPEWKSEQRDSRVRLDPARLEVTQRGQTLYAPLFIDLDPSRRGKALTRRRLTVAENLQATSPEVAVAYRVQIGKKQWVIYRSLDKSGNRTFLGINLISEFLVARFKPDGETEPLIDVSG